jgi:hypothetical protein
VIDYTSNDVCKIPVPPDAVLGGIQVNNALQNYAIQVIATKTRVVRVKLLPLSNQSQKYIVPDGNRK